MLRELLTGIVLGTISGITPGIHVNTLGAIAAAAGMACNLTLFAMGLTHTFLDAIPSTFFGVPDEGTALSILPAHRLALKGRAMEVIRLSLRASFLAVLFTCLLSPLYPALAAVYTPVLGRLFVVGLFVFLMLTAGKRAPLAFLIFLLSGLLGLVVFNLGLSHPYYHLFTGLFGVPVVLGAIRGEAPPAAGDADLWISLSALAGFSFLGTLLGAVASLMPAFTSSQGALVGSLISKDERSFLTMVFSINTSNFLFSFLNFLTTGRVRNGLVSLMSPISLRAAPFFLAGALFVSAVVLLYGEPLARFILRGIGHIPYGPLNLGILCFLLLLSVFFDGLLGLVVLLTASLLGLLAVELGVRRTNCMGVIMLPIIIG